YDRDGNAITVTSPDGYPTTNTYTADGLLLTAAKQVTSATDLRTTTYKYDPAGRKESQDTTRTGQTDPGAETFKFFPNDLPATAQGRPVSTSTAQTGAAQYGYDAAGNETSISNDTYAGAGNGYGSQVS